MALNYQYGMGTGSSANTWTSTGAGASDGTDYVQYNPNYSSAAVTYTKEELHAYVMKSRHGQLSKYLNHNEEHKV